MTFCLNKVLPLFLITAFLAAQLSVTHIHLAEKHGHDGDHHEHNILAHAHDLSNHQDSIDSAPVTDGYSVIELNNDCTHSGCGKTSSQPAPFISSDYTLVFSSKPSSIQSPRPSSKKQWYLSYSTIRLRAPPQLS